MSVADASGYQNRYLKDKVRFWYRYDVSTVTFALLQKQSL